MSFPSSALSTARTALGDPRFNNFGFVSPNEAATIGYVVGPGPHSITVATGMPINPGEDGQAFSVRLEQHSGNSGLHWVRVMQGFGAVLYTWQSGQRTLHFLALTSNSPDHAGDMKGAPTVAARRTVALLLHHETGLAFELLTRLARKTASYNLAILAIGLSGWLLEQAEGNRAVASDRADRLTLMKNDLRAANLEGWQGVTGLRSGDGLQRVCQGAKMLLGN